MRSLTSCAGFEASGAPPIPWRAPRSVWMGGDIPHFVETRTLSSSSIRGPANGQQAMEELMAEGMEELEDLAVEMVGTAEAPTATVRHATPTANPSCR